MIAAVCRYLQDFAQHSLQLSELGLVHFFHFTENNNEIMHSTQLLELVHFVHSC